MIDKKEIEAFVEEGLTGSDCFVVDVQVKPDNVIVVEIDNEEGVDIDRCVALHRFLESKLDRDVEDYELEVGSAGITSPFKVLGQYKKNEVRKGRQRFPKPSESRTYTYRKRNSGHYFS